MNIMIKINFPRQGTTQVEYAYRKLNISILPKHLSHFKIDGDRLPLFRVFY